MIGQLLAGIADLPTVTIVAGALGETTLGLRLVVPVEAGP